MFFALFFGIGLLLCRPADRRAEGCDRGRVRSGDEADRLVIQLAPIAIFCFMFNLAAQFGWDLLFKLAAYVGVVLLALAIQMFGVFPLLLRFLIGNKNPLAFFRETREASLMAFSTASVPTPPCPPRCASRRRS
jgi:Na+/H+-dicarboxylate symporter